MAIYCFTNDLVNNSKLIFRDHRGKNFINSIEIAKDDRNKYICNRWLKWDCDAYKSCYNSLRPHIRPIDDLSNKLILSPVMLLERLIKLIYRNPMAAEQVVMLGCWSRLVSATAIYSQARDYSNNNFNASTSAGNAKKYQNLKKNKLVSNVYRKPLGHQIAKRELFFQVVRPTPYNIATNIIPQRYKGFLCLLERGINIDSFNKSYMLIYNVKIYSFKEQTAMQYKLLNDALEDLWINKYLTINDNDDTDASVTKICINGGIPTVLRVAADTPIMDLFFHVKRLNPFIEFCHHEDANVIVLNHFEGMPFKYVYMSQYETMTYLSPYEINKYEVILTIDEILGPHCDHDIIKNNIGDFKLAKLLFGINYTKNHIDTIHGLPLSIFSAENTIFAHLKNIKPAAASSSNDALAHHHNSYDNSAVQLETIFSADPLCTQDGYLLDNSPDNHNGNDNIAIVFLRRYRIDIEYRNNMNISPYTIPPNFKINEHYIYLCEIQTYDDAAGTLKILKNQKLSVYTVKHGNDCWSHHVYLNISGEGIINAKHYSAHSQVWLFAEQFGSNKRDKTWKLSIQIIIQHVNAKYCGIKFCNFSSQKGLADTHMDLSQRYAQHKPQLVSSIFSIFGRSPLTQIRELLNSNMFETTSEVKKKNKLLKGKCKMVVLRNVSTDHKNINLMRFDNLTINMLQLNDCNLTIYSLLQNSQDPCNKFVFLPKQNKDLLRMVLPTKKILNLN